MFDRLKNFFSKDSDERSPSASPVLRETLTHKAPPPAPQPSRPPRKGTPPAGEHQVYSDHIESAGPGKNVLVRNKYVREDSGTHETLKILSDSPAFQANEDGFDPYNTGRFDRSKNWDKRFGK